MCFSLGWLQQIFIYLIVAGAILAILKLLLPYVLKQFGDIGEGGQLILRAVHIVLWAAIAIFVVIVVFGLISCLLGFGNFSLIPHGR